MSYTPNEIAAAVTLLAVATDLEATKARLHELMVAEQETQALIDELTARTDALPAQLGQYEQDRKELDREIAQFAADRQANDELTARHQAALRNRGWELDAKLDEFNKGVAQFQVESNAKNAELMAREQDLDEREADYRRRLQLLTDATAKHEARVARIQQQLSE